MPEDKQVSEEEVRAAHDLAAMDPRAGADLAALAEQAAWAQAAPAPPPEAAQPEEDKPAPHKTATAGRTARQPDHPAGKEGE